jgi:hypothetical protein
VNAVEEELGELRELVDGRESWTHRERLQRIETERDASKLVRQALDELREVRTSRSNQWREWGSFVISLAAITVAILLKLHGGH